MVLKNTRSHACVAFCLTGFWFIFLIADEAIAKNLELRLGLQQDQYLTPSASQSVESQYSALDLQLQWSRQERPSSYRLNANTKQYFGSSENRQKYYTVPEGWYSYSSPNSDLTFSIGRKARKWSVMEEKWGMGIWEPQFRANYLSPERQGLTGLFIEQTQGRLQWTAFLSGVFVPNQGPQFQLQDGSFSTTSRWFRPPSQQVAFGKGFTQVEYQIDQPKLTRFLRQPSAAVGLGSSKSSLGFWWSSAYAYKPMNQIHLGVEGLLKIDIENNDVVTAEVHPQPLQHHVVTIEMGNKSRDGQYWGSLTYERPEDPALPEEWIESERASSMFGAFGMSQRFSVATFPVKVGAAYLRREILRTQRPSRLFGNITDTSLSRFPYQDVASISLTGSVWNQADSSLKWAGRYFYSLLDQGARLTGQLTWQVEKGLTSYLMFEFLGGKEVSQAESVFSRFRENDRVVGGITYVF